jgi:CHASE2 domain-containing sensor protein
MSNTELDIKESKNKNEVIVTDIQMPFGSMIVFMIKWVLASIPAMIILFLIFFIGTAVFAGIFGVGSYPLR